jgi:hypothetical protein
MFCFFKENQGETTKTSVAKSHEVSVVEDSSRGKQRTGKLRETSIIEISGGFKRLRGTSQPKS